MQDVDLTQGPISGHFRTLAIPAALGMAFATLYNIVDIYFAGWVGTEAQAGLAIGYQAFIVAMAVGFGLGAGLSALVGNAAGRGDMADARGIAAQGISFTVVVSLILAVAATWFGPALITWVSEPGAYRDAATGYFHVLQFALPGFLIAYGCNGILQARGDSRSLQRALMVAFFANIGLNPLFMFGVPGVLPGMGFDGIAAATVVSQAGVAAYILRQILGRDMMKGLKASALRPNWARYREIFTQMAPTTSAIVVMFFSGFIVQYALKGFGEEAVAAFGVALRIEQLLLLPVLGVTGALLPIAAQNFGGGHGDRVRGALFYCWRIGFLISAIAFPALWFGAEWAMRLFTDDAKVVEVGVLYLRVDSVIFPIYMMLFAINSLLQALKRPIWSFWISVYRQGVAVALFIWVFVGLLGFDVIGVWLGVATAVVTGWVLAMILAEWVARREIGGMLVQPQ